MLLLLPLDGLMSVMRYCTRFDQHRLRAVSRGLRDSMDQHILRASHFSHFGSSLADAPEVLVWVPTDIKGLQRCSQATRQHCTTTIKTFVVWACGTLQGAVSRYVAPAAHWPGVECLVVGWQRCNPTPSENTMCTLLQRMDAAGAQPQHLTLSLVGAPMKGRFARTLADFLCSMGHGLRTCTLSLRSNHQLNYHCFEMIMHSIAAIIHRWGVLEELQLDVRGVVQGYLLGTFAGTFGRVGWSRIVTDAFTYELDLKRKRLKLCVTARGGGQHHAIERILWCLRDSIGSFSLDLSAIPARAMHTVEGHPFKRFFHRCPMLFLWTITHQLHLCVLDEVSVRLDAQHEDVPPQFLIQARATPNG